MLAYGLANALQDAWNEQLWKREWVDWHAPSVLRPDLTLGWLAIAPRAPRSSTRSGSARRVSDNHRMDGRMVFLGFGKWARADKIYALQPITGDNRGGGQRTLVWVEGVSDPIVASRTERTILHEMGQDAAGSPLLDEALSLAERLAEDASSGRVDLADLGRRARKLLESSSRPPEGSQLF